MQGGWRDVKGSVAMTVLQYLLGGGGSFSAGARVLLGRAVPRVHCRQCSRGAWHAAAVCPCSLLLTRHLPRGPRLPCCRRPRQGHALAAVHSRAERAPLDAQLHRPQLHLQLNWPGRWPTGPVPGCGAGLWPGRSLQGTMAKVPATTALAWWLCATPGVPGMWHRLPRGRGAWARRLGSPWSPAAAPPTDGCLCSPACAGKPCVQLAFMRLMPLHLPHPSLPLPQVGIFASAESSQAAEMVDVLCKEMQVRGLPHAHRAQGAHSEHCPSSSHCPCACTPHPPLHPHTHVAHSTTTSCPPPT